MSLLLCIGFHYQERLPALIDITALHPLLSAMGPSRTLVVSDMDPRDHCAISALVSHDGSDNGLCGRVDALRKEYRVCRDAETLRGLLRQAAGLRTVLYYSGHNDSKGMIMPDGGRLPWEELVAELRCTSFVALLDCCRCPRLSLPFSWQQGQWRADCPTPIYRPVLVLLACCSEESEDIFSTSIGSPFTRQLVAWLSSSDKSFSSLQRLYPKTRVYSSLPAPEHWDRIVA